MSIHFEPRRTASDVLSEDEVRILYQTVKEAIDRFGVDTTADVILDAHNGKLRRFINQDNLRLFRVYRNRCGSEPYRLISEVLLRHTPSKGYPGGEFTFELNYVGRIIVAAETEDEARAKVQDRAFHLSEILNEDDMVLSDLELDGDIILRAIDGEPCDE